MPLGGGGHASPLAALALPGAFLLCKYSEFRQRRRDANSRRVTERELQSLHNKIGCDIAVMLEPKGRFEPEPMKALECSARRVANFARVICEANPRAIVAVCCEPVEALVPLVSAVYCSGGWYDPGRIIGSCATSEIRCNTSLGRCMGLDPYSLFVPIVGGVSGEALVPIFSRALPSVALTEDKLLNKLEQNEPELATSQEDECVICVNARATMQTLPCGHQVVCRRCFVKTIQSAVAQRMLPLRCVICRARVLRLQTGNESWRLQGSASSYSVSSKSWRVSGSSSSYSMGTQSLGPARVPPSASLYSMSSGSSCGSGVSSVSSSSGAAGHHSGCSGGCLGAVPKIPQNRSYPRRLPTHPIKIRVPDPPGRLPPIKELPRSPARTSAQPSVNGASSSSTRIRCAQKLVTQLEAAPLLGNDMNKHKLEEKSDNRKNELAEKRKDEKQKQKAEKEARKEEKKQARELERQAKLLAKEEKKKAKKEMKQSLLGTDKDRK